MCLRMSGMSFIYKSISGTTLGQLSQQHITNYNKYSTNKPAFHAGLTRYNNL